MDELMIHPAFHDLDDLRVGHAGPQIVGSELDDVRACVIRPRSPCARRLARYRVNDDRALNVVDDVYKGTEKRHTQFVLMLR